MLLNMWASVQRGGEFFSDSGRVEQREKGGFDCVLYYAPGGVPRDVRPSLEKYIRSYARASGWSVQGVRFAKTYACVGVLPSSASKAASRASKKP